MELKKGWAPPGRIWGAWVEFGTITGPTTFKVEFDTISNAPSTFDAEVKYWEGPMLRSEITYGPGSINFTAKCACIQRIRFRSHTTGQDIRIIVK